MQPGNVVGRGGPEVVQEPGSDLMPRRMTIGVPSLGCGKRFSDLGLFS